MLVGENKSIVCRVYEKVWNQGTLAVIDEIYATNFVLNDPVTPEVCGPEGYKQYVTMVRTAFPDIKFTIEDQIAEGDKVATRWAFTGTHKSELKGIPPTGKRCATTGITISRISGGKIAEETSDWNTLGMLQQLGVVPAIGDDG